MKNRLRTKILVMAVLLLLVSSIMTSGLARILYESCTKCGKITEHTEKGIKQDDSSHQVNWVCNECGTGVLGGFLSHSGG